MQNSAKARIGTRAEIESGAVVHPLEADGVGKAPYKMFVVIRGIPAPEALDQARRYHVDPRRCRCCRIPSADLYVIEGADRNRAGLCRACVEQSGDGGLIRRARREDHERARLLDRITTR